jgi:hypothetical protein
MAGIGLQNHGHALPFRPRSISRTGSLYRLHVLGAVGHVHAPAPSRPACTRLPAQD